MRVADRLAALHEERHALLPAEGPDLVAVAPPPGDPHLVDLDAVAAQLTGHAPAGAQAICRGPAAVERGHGGSSGCQALDDVVRAAHREACQAQRQGLAGPRADQAPRGTVAVPRDRALERVLVVRG